MEIENYIKKNDKLKKALNNYLLSNREQLIQYYGALKADAIIAGATCNYPAVIPKITFTDTSMHDSRFLFISRLIAFKKTIKKGKSYWILKRNPSLNEIKTHIFK